MEPKQHWEKVYSSKAATEVSWFQEHAQLSLKLIRDAGGSSSMSILDVGGGASTLVDDLLANGYEKVTVLDLSEAALDIAKTRLGDKANGVDWVEANVLEADFPIDAFDVWHDRAVFHFLTTEEQRQAYVSQVLHAVKAGGVVVVATFAEDGPTKCSGLPVVRYSPEALRAEFGLSFKFLRCEKERHLTPDSSEQRFVYCVFRKLPHSTQRMR